MRIGSLARRPEPEMLPLIADLLDRMPRSGLVPVLDHSVAGQLATQGLGREVATFPTDQVPADLDLVISLGGDGTCLRSVGLVARQGIPVLGVMRIVFSAIPTMQPWAELLSERDDSKLKFQLMSPAMRQRMLATLLANVRRRKPS